jgi:hypothetical protein
MRLCCAGTLKTIKVVESMALIKRVLKGITLSIDRKKGSRRELDPS